MRGTLGRASLGFFAAFTLIASGCASMRLAVSDPAAGCPIELGFLEPGQTVVHPYRLPKGVAVGTYRLAIPMPVPEEATWPELELLTPTFKVQNSPD